MDFDKAIQAHASWKLKLNMFLDNPDNPNNPIDVPKLSLDNVCDLGKWIHGKGKKYSDFEQYRQLVKEHATFHKEAANIVSRRLKGENVKSETALGSNSIFTEKSKKVVSLIIEMKRLENK